jgi:hypothetical protein
VEFIGKNNGNQRLNYLCIPPEDRWNKKILPLYGDERDHKVWREVKERQKIAL